MNTFDQMIGLSEEKKELEHIGDILKNREYYTRLGASMPRGLVITGSKGSGKTMAAHCLMDYCELPVFEPRDEEEKEMPEVYRDAFSKAAATTPSIVFIDDIDELCGGGKELPFAQMGTDMVSCYMDAVANADVFVLATAKDVNHLPDSLMSEGRLEKVIVLRDPEGEDCEEVVEALIDGKSFSEDINCKQIARMVNGNSFADIRRMINEAALIAGYERKEEITMDHVLEAFLRAIINIPGKTPEHPEEKKTVDLSEKSSKLAQIVCHEAGHAVISEVLSPGCVTVVSAHDRKGESGGFTSYYNDRSVLPLHWMEQRILNCLGGRAAVELKYGMVDPGSCQDLDIAFRTATDLVKTACACGLDKHDSCDRNSQNLLEKQEAAVASEVERYYRKAKEILASNWEFFNKVADELAAKRILTETDMVRIRRECGQECEGS